METGKLYQFKEKFKIFKNDFICMNTLSIALYLKICFQPGDGSTLRQTDRQTEGQTEYKLNIDRDRNICNTD